ncbi:hypothetical protein L1887_27489 [Cichorium endivia]|nr:hypothetical protein L1887_27489 [Cichorium endivia]
MGANRRLLENLKATRKELKQWRANLRRVEMEKHNQMLNTIDEIELTAEYRALVSPERICRWEWKNRVLELETTKRKDLKQKARLRWDIDGDENTKFFHVIMNNNKRKNQINGLNLEGTWVMDPMRIKQEERDFFSKIFEESSFNRLKLISDKFKN